MPFKKKNVPSPPNEVGVAYFGNLSLLESNSFLVGLGLNSLDEILTAIAVTGSHPGDFKSFAMSQGTIVPGDVVQKIEVGVLTHISTPDSWLQEFRDAGYDVPAAPDPKKSVMPSPPVPKKPKSSPAVSPPVIIVPKTVKKKTGLLAHLTSKPKS